MALKWKAISGVNMGGWAIVLLNMIWVWVFKTHVFGQVHQQWVYKQHSKH